MRNSKSKKTRSQIIKELDGWFSKYIRLRNTQGGYGRCFTCGARKHWKEVDAGHFQTRSKYSIRWNEKNVQFQCKKCNMTNGGQQYTFGLMLDKEYGEGTADGLVIEGNQTRKFTTGELLEMITHYKREVRGLLK